MPVTMLPVTHRPPGDRAAAVEMPRAVKKHPRVHGPQLALLPYSRRRRPTVERRSLTPGGVRVSTALIWVGSGEAALGLAREPALPRLSSPYSRIESGAPHSSADTQGAQKSFCGIRRTAPSQRPQFVLTLWLWTYFKNASSSASSTSQ
jgi:hypothetical protein